MKNEQVIKICEPNTLSTCAQKTFLLAPGNRIILSLTSTVSTFEKLLTFNKGM